MNNSKKLLLVLADVILVTIVGTLMAIFCNDWSNPVRLAIYILLLLTLTIPGISSLLIKDIESPNAILTIILFVANVIALSIMFGLNTTDHKTLIITEVVMGGLYLILSLVTVAVKEKKE